jgi:Tfp pilus assembly protein PilX
MNLRVRQTGNEEGSILITIMAMILVLMALVMGLFYLVRSASLGTEVERKDLRSFNVAEAGIDAGMLALKTSWPQDQGTSASVDASATTAQFPAATFRRATARAGVTEPPFINIVMYDNSTVPATNATYQAHPNWFTQLTDGTIHPNWDKSTDDPRLTAGVPDSRMVVDSNANVDNVSPFRPSGRSGHSHFQRSPWRPA